MALPRRALTKPARRIRGRTGKGGRRSPGYPLMLVCSRPCPDHAPADGSGAVRALQPAGHGGCASQAGLAGRPGRLDRPGDIEVVEHAGGLDHAGPRRDLDTEPGNVIGRGDRDVVQLEADGRTVIDKEGKPQHDAELGIDDHGGTGEYPRTTEVPPVVPVRGVGPDAPAPAAADVAGSGRR